MKKEYKAPAILNLGRVEEITLKGHQTKGAGPIGS